MNDPNSFEEQIEREPKSSAPWYELIVQAQRAFQDYNDRCDRVDKLYADMNALGNASRDREYQLFWANTQVMLPSIYARPPVPVVVPKFKDRRPVYRVSSEMLERCSVVAFDLTDINSVMLGLRDDLAIIGRGVGWVRYESKEESGEATERVCVEWIHRKDFLHDPARNWSEVCWGARRAWMTLDEMEARFKNVPREVLAGAVFQSKPEDRNGDYGYYDSQQKAGVWEIWHKHERKVVWVTEGVPEILDEDEPFLKLEGFFPFPKPAYATTIRSTLIPVPDVMFYQDQLSEINELTDRIHALAAALQVRGFYPAGAGELGDAIESALSSVTNNKVLVGISNWSAFGGGAAKDSIVWLPTDMVAQTIIQCVELRRQMIEDVYQIMGISDIQRGATEASETATAQALKNQNGSYRVRDKQNELIRIARDMVRIAAEIMAEKFQQTTMLEMSQMEMPTDAEIKRQVRALENQARGIQESIQAALANPEAQMLAQQNPEQAQQIIQQVEQEAQQQIAQLQAQAQEIQKTVTIDQVMKFLRDNKIRPFVLDIETDSTIFPDEQAEKALRNEFLQAFTVTTGALAQLVAAAPEAAPLAGAMLRFALAPYRAGREMDGAIDEFTDAIVNKAQQPPPPNPEMIKAEAQAEAWRADAQYKQGDLQIKMQELELKAQEIQQKPQLETMKEQLKAQTAVQINDAQAQGDVIAEEARLAADVQETAMNLEANAALEAQKADMSIAEAMIDDQFNRDKLAVETQLAYDQLAVQQENARLAAEAKANQPKPTWGDR